MHSEQEAKAATIASTYSFLHLSPPTLKRVIAVVNIFIAILLLLPMYRRIGAAIPFAQLGAGLLSSIKNKLSVMTPVILLFVIGITWYFS
jgi:hypothetical protein